MEILRANICILASDPDSICNYRRLATSVIFNLIPFVSIGGIHLLSNHTPRLTRHVRLRRASRAFA